MSMLIRGHRPSSRHRRTADPVPSPRRPLPRPPLKDWTAFARYGINPVTINSFK